MKRVGFNIVLRLVGSHSWLCACESIVLFHLWSAL